MHRDPDLHEERTTCRSWDVGHAVQVMSVSRFGTFIGALVAPGSLVRQAAVGLCAGLLIGCSLPPIGLWPCGPLGVALFLLSPRNARLIERIARGLFAGIGQFVIGCSFALQFTAFGYVALVMVEACFIALSFVLAPSTKGRYVSLVGLLALGEFAREHVPFGGLPIGGIALGEANGPLAGLARLGGPILVAAATYLTGAGICTFVRAMSIALHDKKRKGADTAIGEFASCGVVLILLTGALLFADLAPHGGTARRVDAVVIVQGGGARGLNEFEVPASTVFAAQLTPTEELKGPVDLVVWPEDTIKLATSLSGSRASSLIGNEASRLHATFLAGVTVNVGKTRFLNEIVAWGPSGSIVATFEKVHAVPFGEYVPDRSFFEHFASFAAVPRDAIVGHASGEITTPAGRFALMMSYETFYAERGRSGVRAGGQLIVVPTNTASYANDAVPAEELAASRLQAISEGRYLLQVATTGYSAVINTSGRVLLRSNLGSRDVLRVEAPLLAGATIYERFGDGPTLLGCLAAVFLGWALALRRRRVRGPRSC